VNKFRQMACVLGIVVALLAATGCASYWRDRGNDAADFIDVGITYSKTPQIGLYAGFQSILTIGYADVDGGMLGLGQGQFGDLPMRNRNMGLAIVGVEQYAFDGHYDALNPASPEERGAGLGMLAYPAPNSAMEFLQCPKFVHLGWIGLNVNCKIGELLDFVLGWTTLDIGGDDGAKRAVKYDFMKTTAPAIVPEKK